MKVLNVAYGNSFSNHWAFTMLKAEVFKYNVFFNFYIAEKYAAYFVEIFTVDVK